MEENYYTFLNTRPFLYQETKKTAELLLMGTSQKEIREKVVEENLYLVESKDRASRFVSEILKRTAFLDEFLLTKLLLSDIHTSKAILLYAILKRDQLFYEWMREVVREKFLVLDLQLLRKDTILFLERKGEQSQKIENWSINTKKKLAGAYQHTLLEANMLRKEGNIMKLQPLIIDPEVQIYLKEIKERHIVEVLLGE